MRLHFILITVFTFILLTGYGQSLQKEDLYGKWRILGSFRDGEQTLNALKDTISNPKHYYFNFNNDGTYTSDVVSLKPGYKGGIMRGKWLLDTTKRVITKIRVLNRKEKRKIPGQWVRRTNEDGIFTLVPVKYPIIEFSKTKLVLYDRQHRAYNVYLR